MTAILGEDIVLGLVFKSVAEVSVMISAAGWADSGADGLDKHVPIENKF